MRKYKDELYPVRHIKDLKELIESSSKLFSEKNAFLRKMKPGGTYSPIKYREFKIHIDALGTILLNLGLKNKKVAVIGENRYEWIVTYFSVVNGVGVIVPLDKELPENEIRHLLIRSEASALIYSEKLGSIVESATEGLSHLEYLISMDLEVDASKSLSFNKLIEKGEKLINEGNRDFLDVEINPDIMSMLLFTSGTTGLAKGVMLSHKNICANIMAMSQFVNTTGSDTLLSVLPLHHTYECTCGIMTPLYKGSTIAFCEGLKHIVKNMNEAQATIMLGVPLIFESMYTRVWRKAEKEGKANKLRNGIKINKALRKVGLDKSKKLFRSIHEALGGHVRMFISGAAAIDPQIVECFNDMGIVTFQGYGLTECSPIVTVNKDRYIKYASTGLSMPGIEIQIHEPDEEGIGEVICKSDSVMLGYYQDEEESQKVLKDSWFYTGDYGYLDEEGFLYITGRKKNVIVTKNGKNIFPEEVEFYLNKSDYIKECLVFGKEDMESGDTFVYAEIVPDLEYLNEMGKTYSEEALYKTIQEIIHDINSKMPLYKRIRRFNLRTEEFEKTTTKKIKRFGNNLKTK